MSLSENNKAKIPWYGVLNCQQKGKSVSVEERHVAGKKGSKYDKNWHNQWFDNPSASFNLLLHDSNCSGIPEKTKQAGYNMCWQMQETDGNSKLVVQYPMDLQKKRQASMMR